VDGVDVSVAIRSTAVTGAVSAVAQHASVRQGLVDHFRQVIEQCDNPGIVMEGRDITTVVAPDAAVRVLLTAPEEVRIQRRQAELVGATATTPAAPIAESLRARDASDQTVVDFMNAAPGVVALDSGPLTFDQTVDALLAIISQPRSA
jgi:cytidylate kinase